MRLLRPLSFAALLLLGACGSEAPYLQSDYLAHQRGQVQVCYDPKTTTNFSPVQELAEGVCKQYDRTAQLQFQQPYACSWSAPTLAIFNCVARPGETPPPLVHQVAPLRRVPPEYRQ